MRSFITATVLALICSMASAGAMEVKDVIRLSRLKLEDEVIMAQIKAKKVCFTLSTDQIAELKKAGVSDLVIKYMIETGAAAAAAKKTGENGPASAEETEDRPPAAKSESEKEPATGAAEKPAQPSETAKPPADGLGTLEIENLDDRDYSVQFDARNGRVFFWLGSDAVGRSRLPANSSLVYRVAPRSYKLRWVGEIPVYEMAVAAGSRSRAVLAGTTKGGTDTVKLTTYEGGERRGGGRLVILAGRSPAESTTAAAPATNAVVEKHYYYATPQPAATTTCIVRRPRHYCYSNYCSYGRYHPGCRFHRHYRRRTCSSPTIGFMYGWKRGKSGYAIGINTCGRVGFTYGRKIGRGRYAIGIGW